MTDANQRIREKTARYEREVIKRTTGGFLAMMRVPTHQRPRHLADRLYAFAAGYATKLTREGLDRMGAAMDAIEWEWPSRFRRDRPRFTYALYEDGTEIIGEVHSWPDGCPPGLKALAARPLADAVLISTVDDDATPFWKGSRRAPAAP